MKAQIGGDRGSIIRRAGAKLADRLILILAEAAGACLEKISCRSLFAAEQGDLAASASSRA
jgi:hypothetical protein